VIFFNALRSPEFLTAPKTNLLFFVFNISITQFWSQCFDMPSDTGELANSNRG